MRKFEGMLLACDMDGTLLDSDRCISPENLQAIHYFVSEGGLFSLATGRAFAAVTDYLSQLPVNAPYSLLNGSLIMDAQHQPLHCAGMPVQSYALIEEVLERFPQIGCEVFFAGTYSGLSYECRDRSPHACLAFGLHLCPNVCIARSFRMVSSQFYGCAG